MKSRSLARGAYHVLVPAKTRISIHRINANLWTRHWNTTHPTPLALTPGLLSSLIPPGTAMPHHTSPYDVILCAATTWQAIPDQTYQITMQLQGEGHRIFFIDPSRTQDLSPRQHDALYEVGEIAPKIFVVHLNASGADDVVTAIDMLRRDYAVFAAITLVQTPAWAPVAFSLRRQCHWPVIFQRETAANMALPTLPAHEQEHLRMLREQSDLILIKQPAQNANNLNNAPPYFLMSEANDFASFAANTNTSQDWEKSLTHPCIGYYGTLADMSDLNTLHYLALQHSDWQFVVFGEVLVDLAQVRAIRNIHIIGPISLPLRHHDIHAIDVGIFPFLAVGNHAEDITHCYEVLSTGKPVVALRQPAFKDMQGAILQADDGSTFVGQIERALAEDNGDLAKRRITYVANRTMQMQMAAFESAIAETFPKATIILVTYKNLALTRQCIESVLRNTTYPNYEILIIDNCSTDDTPAYLRQLAQVEPRVHIILNTENKGFAGANNQGIVASTGKYIVLLNNDTVVPRGWLWRHIRHLDDPNIGMVGPRTNKTKGAAPIDVPYKDFTMMEVFAAERMQKQEGTSFDIGTLIMFCVAMRRDVIERVGLLDENFGIGMYEDDDYSERVRRAGYRLICANDIFVHHHNNASFKKIPSQEHQMLRARNRAYFEQKWGRKAHDD